MMSQQSSQALASRATACAREETATVEVSRSANVQKTFYTAQTTKPIIILKTSVSRGNKPNNQKKKKRLKLSREMKLTIW